MNEYVGKKKNEEYKHKKLTVPSSTKALAIDVVVNK